MLPPRRSRGVSSSRSNQISPLKEGGVWKLKNRWNSYTLLADNAFPSIPSSVSPQRYTIFLNNGTKTNNIFVFIQKIWIRGKQICVQLQGVRQRIISVIFWGTFLLRAMVSFFRLSPWAILWMENNCSCEWLIMNALYLTPTPARWLKRAWRRCRSRHRWHNLPSWWSRWWLGHEVVGQMDATEW